MVVASWPDNTTTQSGSTDFGFDNFLSLIHEDLTIFCLTADGTSLTLKSSILGAKKKKTIVRVHQIYQFNHSELGETTTEKTLDWHP